MTADAFAPSSSVLFAVVVSAVSTSLALVACGSSAAPDTAADGAASVEPSDAATPRASGSSSGASIVGAGSSGGSTRADAAAVDDGSGTGSASDGGAGADASTVDGGIIWNLQGWQLQLPIGSQDDPTIIDNPTSFSDAYFYVDSDGALTFMDPVTGVTTSGSQHPRSELKEDTAGWPATGTNTMTATVAVPQVPSTVTIGQIFQAPNAPSKPLLELQYQAGGHVQMLLESTNQGGDANTYDAGHVADKAKFDYSLSLTDNQIQIVVDGQTSSYAMPSSFDGETFYFKWGDYDQTATAGTPTATAGTIVKFYAHAVTHQ